MQVDWCDAFEYCRWAGKHLCGKIGGGGLWWDDPTESGWKGSRSAAVSEWYNACSHGGTRSHPYGEYSISSCNIASGEPFPVKFKLTCEGGYPGLFDLSGNVDEWDDACWSYVDPDLREHDGCLVRGGYYGSITRFGDFTACGFILGHGRDQAGPGIRCCASAI